MKVHSTLTGGRFISLTMKHPKTAGVKSMYNIPLAIHVAPYWPAASLVDSSVTPHPFLRDRTLPSKLQAFKTAVRDD